jgi:DNA-directed RNA polymerase subunit M/transcription elongation factor TFIIS
MRNASYLHQTGSKAMTVQVELPCPKCKSTKMKFERPEIRETDIITCAACGHNLGIREKMNKAYQGLNQAGAKRKLQ